MTKQQEEEAAAEHVIDKDNVTPVENISQPAPAVVADDQPQVSKPKGNADAKVSSPLAKGEFKTITHALKKKVYAKCTYKSSMHLLNDHHKHHHEPQMCGICDSGSALASSLNRHMYSHA